MVKKQELMIFYAWQSDSPEATNKTAIRAALKKAAETLLIRHDRLSVIIDDATRGLIGSGNVPDSIRLKIEACDIFVGDVTTINPSLGEEDKDRRCPNPNVAFEAGIAASHVGWNRMILLTNTAFGPMSDLPFDFDRQRISQFDLAEAPNAKKRKALADLMTVALEVIVKGNPKRPEEMRALNPKQVHRKRDVANIIWAMSQVSIGRLEAIIADLPDRVRPYSHYVNEKFHAVVTSASFHIYDRKLAKAFRKLDQAWDRAFSFGQHYFSAPNGVYIFGTPRGALPHPDERVDYATISSLAVKMRKQLETLLAIVRTDYLEVDLEETDRIARERFNAEVGEVEAILSGDGDSGGDGIKAEPEPN
ncbi:hypothetical protein EN943_07500 [Mesorhizobium sp. M7A.F.Ca.US.006.01.1.1]|uniref:hypothetical protein n=1 Tax=Mesorhizobium sp. M7A.F.Ca.US.006.01.1.1 TaxID=2496707 RepID=UPI000FCB527C|nr:hypothetical protein [Mesorhizobium sp. M7A.F.Ca.US.006.01.1.1]RUZ79410.1 hypothetical protein EN943_07500 [Mesorhizobium sp. M7A.F.Ca.US.006.01.1.1]